MLCVRHPGYIKRVRKLIGIEQLKKTVNFLVKLNRYFGGGVNLGTLELLVKARDVRRGGKRDVVKALPTKEHWEGLKQGNLRFSEVPELTVKITEG